MADCERNRRIDLEVARLHSLHPDLKRDVVLKLAAHVIDAVDAAVAAERVRSTPKP